MGIIQSTRARINHTPLRLLGSTLLIGVVCGFAISCSPASAPPLETLEAISDPKAKMSFTMGNREIRQDIITALDEQNIEHWLNEDNSVGFYAADAEAVDAIGFNAIGAYAARN